MLKGEFTFVRADRNQGTSQKTGKEYDFANLTVSDGLESYSMPMSFEAYEQSKHLRKGDTIMVEIAVSGRQGRANYEVDKVEKKHAKVAM